MRTLRLCALLFFCCRVAVAEEAVTLDIPVLDGPWVKIANREPALLGEYSNPGKQNVCDFTIWQAADKTWQMVACVRQVNWPKIGERLFYRWEAQNLEDPDWKEMGVFATPDEALFQYASIQAPHCFVFEGKTYMFYNGGTAPGPAVPFDPANPRQPRSKGNSSFCKVSLDGKTFSDLPGHAGDVRIFSMGRDVMVFHDADNARFIAYFQDKPLPGEAPSKNGYMYARSAPRPEGPWSERINIQNQGNPESPFVIKRGDWYYLWEQMTVFVSKDPLVFREKPVTKMTPGPRHGYFAPEIIEHEGQTYVAGYAGDGIYLAKVRWESKTLAEIEAWRAKEWAEIEAARAPPAPVP